MQIVKMLVDRHIGESSENCICCELLPMDIGKKARTEVVRCSSINHNSGHSLIRITDDAVHSIDKFIWSKPETAEKCSIVKIGYNQYLAAVTNNNCQLAHFITESGCFMTSATFNPKVDYGYIWTLLSPNSTCIANLTNRMRDAGYIVRKISSKNLNMDLILTGKQDEALKYAFDTGYYDVPKKAITEDLCKVLGRSKSTVSVMLRDAERKIIGLYLGLNIGSASDH
ncbi:MAG: helix-turn-helix domain-containing protein [archaeon]|nr:helix-turn-helix domain-containing protein [archaeon]